MLPAASDYFAFCKYGQQFSIPQSVLEGRKEEKMSTRRRKEHKSKLQQKKKNKYKKECGRRSVGVSVR